MSNTDDSPPNKRRMMSSAAMGVALILLVPVLVVFWFVFLRCGPTYYATGFTEAKFASLREGMSPNEVEAIMGPPLEKIQQEDGTTLWTYSNRDDDTCDFEMRWVYFAVGKAKHVVDMFWYD